jgi:hypothetical protein
MRVPFYLRLVIAHPMLASLGVVVWSISWPYSGSPASTRSESRAPRPIGFTSASEKEKGRNNNNRTSTSNNDNNNNYKNNNNNNNKNNNRTSTSNTDNNQ